jgi:predicted O-methyltransferase YrrM
VPERPCTWQDVPGYFDFGDLYFEMVSRAPPTGARFVEIGVFCGRSTLYMANTIQRSGKPIAFDAIDRFSGFSLAGFEQALGRMSPEHAEIAKIAREFWPDRLEGIVEHFLRQAGLAGIVRVRKGNGQAWAPSYEDGSLDFVFIDADHSYKATKELILAYLPKMAVGGTIAGHDFSSEWPGVMKAVNEIFGRDRRVRWNCWRHEIGKPPRK